MYFSMPMLRNAVDQAMLISFHCSSLKAFPLPFFKTNMPRGKRSRSNERKQPPKPVRKSTRLQELRRKTPEQNPLLPSPSATKSPGEEACLSYHSLYCMKKTNPMTLSKAPNSSKNEIDHKKSNIHPLRFRNLLRNEYEPQQQAVLLKTIAP